MSPRPSRSIPAPSSAQAASPIATHLRGRTAAWAGSLLGDTWPPLMLFALAIGQLMLVAHLAGFDPLASQTWRHWDSGHYLSIAVNGYAPLPCQLRGPGAIACTGDGGWFPGYPWLVGALWRLGLPLGGAAVLVSWSFALATLVLLWRTFLGGRATAATLGALTFAAFAPGQVYHYAAFPLSMLTFFTVLHLWLLRRQRWVAAGLAGAAAAMSYPIGVLLVGLSGAWALIAPGVGPWQRRVRALAVVSGLTAGGFGAVLLAMQVGTGAWSTYFQVQGIAYGNDHLVDPLRTLWLGSAHGLGGGISPLLHATRLLGHWGNWQAVSTVVAAQTLLVTVVVGLVVIHAVLRGRRLGRVDLLLLGWMVLFFVFPLTQANAGLYRSQAALLPVAVLARCLPRALLWVLALGCVVVASPIAWLFLHNSII